MSKRTTFTTITPLPPSLTRETVMETLHSHTEMIDLNPLVEKHQLIKPPSNATPEEFHCSWYSLTDRVQYLPGGIMSGKVSYNVCFHNLENGLQTHCYAPLGLNIKDKWTLGGSMPGEPAMPVEIGIGAPINGLYIREDVSMTCNFMMTSFVRKTLKRVHAALIERLLMKAKRQIGMASMDKALEEDGYSQYLYENQTQKQRRSRYLTPHVSWPDCGPRPLSSHGGESFQSFHSLNSIHPSLRHSGRPSTAIGTSQPLYHQTSMRDTLITGDNNPYPRALTMRSSVGSQGSSLRSQRAPSSGPATPKSLWHNLALSRRCSPDIAIIEPANEIEHPACAELPPQDLLPPKHSGRTMSGLSGIGWEWRNVGARMEKEIEVERVRERVRAMEREKESIQLPAYDPVTFPGTFGRVELPA